VNDLQTPTVDWVAMAPIIAVAGAGVAIVLVRAWMRRSPWVTTVGVVLALVGVAVAFGFLARQWFLVRDDGAISTMGDMVRVDAFAVFLGIVVMIATACALLISIHYLRVEGLEGPEYLALLLLSSAGMLAMTTANDLVVVFLALEVLSIPLYVLAAFDRRRLASQEAGIKYFVLGAFSSAIFLYGVALVYGATGTTSLEGIFQFLAENTVLDQGVLVAGIALLLVGLGFKVSAAPFHMWTPDVYQGAPTPVTTFMAAATKVAGFAALLRVFEMAFPLYRDDWRPMVWILSALSMIVGSVAAVVQTDVKRILAYSSISHAGFILIGFVAGTAAGIAASLFYLFTYSFMVVGSFTVVTVVARRGDDSHSLSDYRGLANREPVLAGLLAFFLLAQAGVPLTGGFIAKLEVFSSAVDAREYALVIIAVLAAVVATFFYLRIIVTMFVPSPDEAVDLEAPDVPRGRSLIDPGAAVVLTVAAVIVLVLGILPAQFLEFAADATFQLV
jgi:NADH-quinone oxidoreductase subunit N